MFSSSQTLHLQEHTFWELKSILIFFSHKSFGVQIWEGEVECNLSPLWHPHQSRQKSPGKIIVLSQTLICFYLPFRIPLGANIHLWLADRDGLSPSRLLHPLHFLKLCPMTYFDFFHLRAELWNAVAWGTLLGLQQWWRETFCLH